MTTTFAQQAQNYFERYRAILQEIKETDAALAQLQRKANDLQAERAHMSQIIVHHIDTGNDIMMCALNMEKPGAVGAEDRSNLAKIGWPSVTMSRGSSSSLVSDLAKHINTGQWTTVDMGVGVVDLWDQNATAKP